MVSVKKGQSVDFRSSEESLYLKNAREAINRLNNITRETSDLTAKKAQGAKKRENKIFHVSRANQQENNIKVG